MKILKVYKIKSIKNIKMKNINLDITAKILELGIDNCLNPNVIFRNTEYALSTARKYLFELYDRKLLERIQKNKRGYLYLTSDKGKAFLKTLEK